MNRLPLLLYLTVAFSFLVPTAARAAEAQIIVRSESGDPLLRGFEGTITSGQPSSNSVLSYTGYAESPESTYITVSFRGPAGGPLRPGVFEDTIDKSRSAEDDAKPCLNVWRYDVDTSDLRKHGRFEILKVTYDVLGQVTAFHATFFIQAEGATGGIVGEIRHNLESTVPSMNQAPGVQIGNGRLYVLPNTPLVLPGVASDDGLPLASELSYSWSAPKGVTLDNPNSLRPTATFSEIGTYSLSLSVSDGSGTSWGYLDVHVLPPGIESAVQVRSPPGERVLRGRDLEVTRFDGPITCFTNYNRTTLAINAVARDNYAYLELSGLGLDPQNFIRPGIYPIASEVGPGTFKLSIRGPGGSTNQVKGTLDLRNLEMDSSGRITQLWMFLNIVDSQTGDHASVERSLMAEIRYGMPEGSIVKQPPIVNAGFDQYLVHRQRSFLAGNALSDRAVLPMLTWSKVSGPGEVQFDHADARATEVTFSQPGTYKLRLTANDGESEVSDELVIEKSPAETSLILRGIPLSSGGAPFNDFYSADECIVAPFPVGFDNKVKLDIFSRWQLLAGVSLSPAAEDQPLKPGVYENALSGAPNGYMVLYQLQQSLSGQRLTIREIETDENGNLRSLHALLDSDLRHGDYQLHAEIRYNATNLSDPAPNLAPKVLVTTPYAAPAQSFSLDGRVVDDGFPEGQPLQVNWEQIDGPSIAVIDDPQCLRPTVSLSANGVYRFRLTASDGEFSQSAEVTIAVQPGARRYVGTIDFHESNIGRFSLTRRGSDFFTARLLVPGGSVPLTGQFIGGRWFKSYLNSNHELVAFELKLTANGTGIYGTVSIGGRIWTLEANQTEESGLLAVGQPAKHAGTYNLLLAPISSSAPKAPGFARVTVNAVGKTRCSARLPDGTSVLFSTSSTVHGTLPFFAPLYGGRGSLGGEFELIDSRIGGPLVWRHPKRRNHPPFTSEFATRVTSIGDPYVSPSHGLNLITQTSEPQDAVITMTDGSDGDLLSIPLRFNVNGSITTLASAAGFSLKIQPGTGLFRGFFSDPRDAKRRAFSGIINPKYGAGVGYFITSDGAGRVRLESAQTGATSGRPLLQLNEATNLPIEW